jgi:putative oxidoreductase
MISESALQPWAPRLLGLLRIVTGFLFLQHGTAKLLHVPHVAMFDGLQTGSLVWYAGMLEIIGGPLILIGLCTRPVAFVLSGMMAVAYFKAHFPNAPLPILNGGELAVVWCFTFLYFAAAGGGAWSVDALRARSA